MNQEKISVTKASGLREPFSEEKVRRSIHRAGIPKKLENQVVGHIREIIYDGIPTYDIYKHITEFLYRSPYPQSRALYGLKEAIMQLGPSGFPFEKYVAAVLKQHGYSVQTNVILSGKCVEHEIDVIAQKSAQRFMIECKFHNQPGARSDLKVALYVQARFADFLHLKSDINAQHFDQAWLVTNTKTTSEAQKYAACVGLHIIGWNYPQTGNLQEYIEIKGLRPITNLTSLTQEEKRLILSQGVVLCRDLLSDNQDLLSDLGFSQERRAALEREIKILTRTKE